jgi:hypothetical protein
MPQQKPLSEEMSYHEHAPLIAPCMPGSVVHRSIEANKNFLTGSMIPNWKPPSGTIPVDDDCNDMMIMVNFQ